MTTIKINGMELTKAEKYMGCYKDIKIPEGFELLTIYEALAIFDEEDNAKKLLEKKDWNEWISIPCKQLNIDIKNNDSSWLYRNGSDRLYAWGNVLPDLGGTGRVIFKKIEEKENDKRD